MSEEKVVSERMGKMINLILVMLTEVAKERKVALSSRQLMYRSGILEIFWLKKKLKQTNKKNSPVRSESEVEALGVGNIFAKFFFFFFKFWYLTITKFKFFVYYLLNSLRTTTV